MENLVFHNSNQSKEQKRERKKGKKIVNKLRHLLDPRFSNK